MKRGITLIEMTIVILVLLMLTSLSVVSVGAYRSWAKGSEASHTLRQVYNAQRTFLAENPTMAADALVDADIIPYLSTGAAALPTIEDLDGNTLTIDVSVSPPEITGGYDPSGSPNDGYWDVGK